MENQGSWWIYGEKITFFFFLNFGKKITKHSCLRQLLTSYRCYFIKDTPKSWCNNLIREIYITYTDINIFCLHKANSVRKRDLLKQLKEQKLSGMHKACMPVLDILTIPIKRNKHTHTPQHNQNQKLLL